MRVVTGHDALFGQWAAQQIPHAAVSAFGDFVALGIVDADNIIRGAALYHNYVPDYRSIEITFALESPRYLSRSVIAGIMAYPWKQLDVLRVSAITPRSAASARRFLETFGFKREGLARFGFGDYGDAVLYGLTRKDWDASRFNGGRRLDGKERPQAAASSGPYCCSQCAVAIEHCHCASSTENEHDKHERAARFRDVSG